MTFTKALFATAFEIASVPATPPPITVTILGEISPKEPINTPFPELCLSK